VDSPKVTVLISIYNGEKYLKEGIESILIQTYRDFEFIIHGGSTDGNTVILALYLLPEDIQKESWI
jgi:glycosyltransferase involved in cell wall biosynthesis